MAFIHILVRPKAFSNYGENVQTTLSLLKISKEGNITIQAYKNSASSRLSHRTFSHFTNLIFVQTKMIPNLIIDSFSPFCKLVKYFIFANDKLKSNHEYVDHIYKYGNKWSLTSLCQQVSEGRFETTLCLTFCIDIISHLAFS